MNLLSLAVSLFVINISGISDCGTMPFFTIVSQSFTPSAPKAGENVSWSITYKVPDNVEVTSGRSVNSGTINGFIPIDPTVSDLCTIVECPILSGEYTSTSYQTWPDGLAGTKLALTTQWVDESYNELLCSKVVVTGAQSQQYLRGN